MTPTTLSDLVFEEWLRALQMAYKHAKAARLAHLRNEIWRKYDQQGVHSYSAEWGRIFACEVLIPELAVMRAEFGEFIGPVGLRAVAEKDALAEFITEMREEAA